MQSYDLLIMLHLILKNLYHIYLQMFKNLTKIVLIMEIAIICYWNFSYAQLFTPQGVSDILPDNPYIEDKDNHECNPSDIACFISKDSTPSDDSSSLLNRLLSVFNLDSERYKWVPKFILYVKFIVNLWLGLLSFVALVMLIYTFYMIFFWKSEDWIKTAIWNLKGIFIALAVMWLSRLIVSFIFWWYKANWQNDTTYTAYLIENGTQMVNISNTQTQEQFYLSV